MHHGSLPLGCATQSDTKNIGLPHLSLPTHTNHIGSTFSHPGTIHCGIWQLEVTCFRCRSATLGPGSLGPNILSFCRATEARPPEYQTVQQQVQCAADAGFQQRAYTDSSPGQVQQHPPFPCPRSWIMLAHTLQLSAHTVVHSVRISKSIQPSEDPDALARRPPLRTQAGHMEHREAAVVVTGVRSAGHLRPANVRR